MVAKNNSSHDHATDVERECKRKYEKQRVGVIGLKLSRLVLLAFFGRLAYETRMRAVLMTQVNKPSGF